MIDIKDVAKNVIVEEADTVRNLVGFIDDDFEKVVKLIYESKGRVIIKSVFETIATIRLLPILRISGTSTLISGVLPLLEIKMTTSSSLTIPISP